jgi:translation initiation factor IF-3
MATGRPRIDPRQNQRGPQIRINHRIRVPEVRVIGSDGSMLGIMSTHEALAMAQQQTLDLVEVNPKAAPPVCKILDFGKYKYETAKQAREARRKQTVIDIKEIKLRPKTDDHDLSFKSRAARRFIESGNKVKFTVRFRGREITHPEMAQQQLGWLMQQSEDVANVELRPQMEGRAMTLLLAPKPQILQRVAQAKVQREKERQKALSEGRTPLAEGDTELDADEAKINAENAAVDSEHEGDALGSLVACGNTHGPGPALACPLSTEAEGAACSGRSYTCPRRGRRRAPERALSSRLRARGQRPGVVGAAGGPRGRCAVS